MSKESRPGSSLKTAVQPVPVVGQEQRRAIPVVIPKRILIFAPHADDEVLSCGGVILKYTQWGTESIVLVATPGIGGSPNLREPSKVERTRREEFETCKRELHLSDLSEFLSIDEPLVCQANVELFTRNIRQLKPDLVFFPHPEDRHRVHREVSLLTLEALFHSPTGAYEGAGREWLPYGAYCYESISGTFGTTIPARTLAISDITGQYHDKMRIMRRAYRTQSRLLRTYISWVESMARLRGIAGRCEYGEAFVPETGHVPLKILVV